MSRAAGDDMDWRQRNESQLLRRGSRGRLAQIVAGLASVTTVVLFGGVAGPIGVVAGLVTVAVWWVVGPAHAVATAAVLLAAVASGGQNRIGVAVAVLFVLVLAPALDAPEPVRYAAVVTLAATGFVAGTWLLVAVVPLWAAAVTLVGVLGVVAVLFARYHLLVLGLLGPETGSEGSQSPRPESESLMDDEPRADNTDTAAETADKNQ